MGEAALHFFLCSAVHGAREGSGCGNMCSCPVALVNEGRPAVPTGACPLQGPVLRNPSPQACGVDYEVKAFCAENLEEKIHKR